MSAEVVERLAERAEVPERDGGVGGGGGEEKALDGVERHRVDLAAVRAQRLQAAALPDVVEEHTAVVAARCEQIRIDGVPGHVLHDVALLEELADGREDGRFAGGREVPETHFAVVRARSDETLLEGRPAETVALLRVALQNVIRTTDRVARDGGVLANVEDVDVSVHCLRRDDHWVLRHVASLVRLSVVSHTNSFRHMRRKPLETSVFCGKG